MRKSLISLAIASSSVLFANTAIAGNAPASAAAAPSGSIVSNDAVVSQLIAINNTQQSPAVVDNIGTQVANAGGTYNAATGLVRAFVDTGATGVFLLVIENGNVSFTPVEG